MRVVDPDELPRQPTTRDDWIELSDGCRLCSRTVLPVDAASEAVPAVLEYLPYGPTDGTPYTDATHHPYFAGHGYASIRVDMRGSGNSEIRLDEYLPREQEDACEVIAWIARQPCATARSACSASRGARSMGCRSRAAGPALKAVVSAYSADPVLSGGVDASPAAR